ncbi:MAG: hypothetical protein DRO39_04040, partial [Thermoprotei archaeon]
MPLYFFTLGFHADHVIRRLQGARDVEGIAVATAEPVVRAVGVAFGEVSSFCEKVRLPAPRMVPLDLSDPGGSVVKILEVLRGYSSVVADLSGGMRSIVVLSMTALLIHSLRASVRLYMVAEREDAPEMSIPLDVVRIVLSTGLSAEKKRVLRTIDENPGLGIADLARLLGKSEKTVRNYVSEFR